MLPQSKYTQTNFFSPLGFEFHSSSSPLHHESQVYYHSAIQSPSLMQWRSQEFATVRWFSPPSLLSLPSLSLEVGNLNYYSYGTRESGGALYRVSHNVFLFVLL